MHSSFFEIKMITPCFVVVFVQVPGFPRWFNVKYDDDVDVALYAVEMAKDYEAGDMVVRVQ